MVSHVRFGNDSDDEQKTFSSDGVQVSSRSKLSNMKISQKKTQMKSSSETKRKSRSKLPAKQIRNLERFLNYKEHELPPGVVKKKREELEEWKRVQAERERRARERNFEKRYRRVKFFEIRKVQRILQNIAERGDRPEDQDAKLQAQKDLLYIQQYPKDKKYIALFPSGGHSDESKKKVEQMRALIEGSGVAAEEQMTLKTNNALTDDFFVDLDMDNENK